jgi:hypothetical protein
MGLVKVKGDRVKVKGDTVKVNRGRIFPLSLWERAGVRD